jgi:hypothetical protein
MPVARRIVLGDRLLEERDPAGLHHLREANGVIEVETAIGVDEELDVRPDCFAHRAHARRVLLDDIRERLRLAPAQRLVPHDHFQTPEPLRHPELRGRGKLVAVEEVEAERGVQRYAWASPAEEPPHRLLEGLALDVPQRDVHGRERLHAETSLAPRCQCPIELVPDRLAGQRIIALDRRRDDAVHDLGDHGFTGNRRQTVANNAGIGCDLHETALERRFPLDARQRDLQRDVERRRRDTDNFHGLRDFAGDTAGRQRKIISPPIGALA